MTRPDLEAIRARWEKRGQSFDDKDEFERKARTDIPALLAYIEDLERELCCETGAHEWRRSMKYDIKCTPARYELRAIFPEALDKDGLVAYVRELQGKLSQADERVLSADKRLEQCARERDEARQQLADALANADDLNVDNALRIAEGVAKERDEALARIDELKAEVTSIEDMLDNAHAREDANWFEVNRLKDRIAELERVKP